VGRVAAVSRLERIIIVPRNGYANRLQAWASAAVLARELQVPLLVAWEAESIATAPAEALFDSALIDRGFITPAELTEILGVDHSALPRYLYEDRARGFLSLAGHDRGEQIFMRSLQERLALPGRSSTLVIMAGGLFALPSTEDFEHRRRAFYSALPWNSGIQDRVDHALSHHSEFFAVHVRQTDRSLEAPTKRGIIAAMTTVHRTTGQSEVFLAADTASAVESWTHLAAAHGLEPWSVDLQSRDRSSAQAGIDALVDWLLLTKAKGLVYTRESSFGHEAAVAADALAMSRAVRAPALVVAARRGRRHGHNAIQFVQRRMSRS